MRLDFHSQEGVYARKKFLEVRIIFFVMDVLLSVIGVSHCDVTCRSLHPVGKVVRLLFIFVSFSINWCFLLFSIFTSCKTNKSYCYTIWSLYRTLRIKAFSLLGEPDRCVYSVERFRFDFLFSLW